MEEEILKEEKLTVILPFRHNADHIFNTDKYVVKVVRIDDEKLIILRNKKVERIIK